MKFVHVESLAHFFAEDAFVSEVPTVEVTVLVVGFFWVDVLHGRFGEGRNWVGGVLGRPHTGG